MLFPEHLLEDWTAFEALEEGRRLYWGNQVVRTHVAAHGKDGLSITGTVGRTDARRVRLVIRPDRQRFETYQCSCGYDGAGLCAHEVALGLAAVHEPDPVQRQPVTFPLVARPGVLPEHLAERLEALGVRRGDAGSLRQRERVHELDHIRVQAEYEPVHDRVELSVTAVYGPFELPLMLDLPDAPRQLTDDKGRVHAYRRDWLAEESALAFFVQHAGPAADRDRTRFFIESDGLYAFLTDTLPQMVERFEVDIAPAVQALTNIERETIASDWQVKQEQGQGWFDFSVEWHCGQTQVPLADLRRMVTSQKPYIRRADGRFIECANREDVKRWLEAMDASEQTPGGYRSRLFLAPEIMRLIRESHGARVASTNAAFETFLAEAETGRLVRPINWPASLDQALRAYQKDGVSWMMFLHRYGFGGVLADDMGLGKTLQVLAVLSIVRQKTPQPSLIVCPKTLTLTWANEIKKFTPDLSVLVLDGTQDERRRLHETIQNYDVVITPYSVLSRDIRLYASRAPFLYCVLDEAQYIKNAQTMIAQAVKVIPSQYRLAVTGTPLENHVRELWSIFDFLMPGFLGDLPAFRRRFERPIQEQRGSSALADLKRKVGPFLLRRTKASALKDLPPKIEQTSLAALSPEQLVVYARTLAEVRAEVAHLVEQKGFQRSRIEILSALTKLRRITDHPALVDRRLPRTEELSGKMALALELVREALSGGHKVLLFSQFTSMLDILREALDRERIGHCTIEGKTKNRQQQVETFLHDPAAGVFLLSLKAGGTGLTLTAADTVILYDPWWNPQVERQAMDRAHRIGQAKTVNVYKLVTQGTVEEKVVALQARKQQLFDAIMEERAEEISGLTWEDVRGLLD